MSQPLIFFQRHGETELNAQGAYRGWTDVPLNETGIKQAEHAAEFLKSIGLVRLVVSSDLKRAVQTSEIISKYLGLGTIETDRELRPLNVGDFTGKDKDEFPLDPYLDNPSRVIPGGESIDQFGKRTSIAIAQYLKMVDAGAKGLLLVTHASNITFVASLFDTQKDIATS